MKYEIVTLPRLVLAGAGRKISRDPRAVVMETGLAWADFWINEIHEKVRNKVGKNVFGVYTAFEGDPARPGEFFACCQTSDEENTGDFELIVIPEGTYAKFSSNPDIKTTVAEIWQAVEHCELNRAHTFDLEIYHKDGNDPESQVVEVYVATK